MQQGFDEFRNGMEVSRIVAVIKFPCALVGPREQRGTLTYSATASHAMTRSQQIQKPGGQGHSAKVAKMFLVGKRQPRRYTIGPPGIRESNSGLHKPSEEARCERHRESEHGRHGALKQ